MKSLIRNSFFNALALFILTLLLPGVNVSGGTINFIIAGVLLTLLFKILKPILSLITLPLNLITLGIFSFFVNAIILYLAVILFPAISISEFVFPGSSFYGFVIPRLSVNTIVAYVLCSFLLTSINSFLNWLIKR